MGVCTFFAFITIVCWTFYITPINACWGSPSPSYDRALDYYDANSERQIVNEWKTMVSSPIDERTAVQQLENEANDLTGKQGSRMREYLNRAKVRYRPVPGMTQAECLVVMMYTDDGDSRAFFQEYKKANINKIWRPYSVYTTLLLSALEKLARIDPIPSGATLYRGVNFRAEPPKSGEIFWKSFTSTSLNIDVAIQFAESRGTILEFQRPNSNLAARVRKLSNYYYEDEVLISPFVMFSFDSANGDRLHFSRPIHRDELKKRHAQ